MNSDALCMQVHNLAFAQAQTRPVFPALFPALALAQDR